MAWKIAICEDEKSYRDQIDKLIHDWAKQNGQKIKVSQFENAIKLLGAWDDTSSFDAFFMDVELPGGMDGMAFASTVRKVDDSVPIIFIKSHSELIQPAKHCHSVHPEPVIINGSFESSLSLLEMFISFLLFYLSRVLPLA